MDRAEKLPPQREAPPAQQWAVEPIGWVRSPFVDKASAPRQPAAARGVRGSIELVAGRGYEHATAGLESFSHLWVIFLFNRALGHVKNTVLPPRSERKRGVFATRSPHRPNSLGLSVLRLISIEGLCLTVEDLDLCDRTPVLDIKPYLHYSDAIGEANNGWLEKPDEAALGYQVSWSERALEQLAFLREQGLELGVEVETLLAAGPLPHPYRRIRKLDDGTLLLARRSWRYHFRVDERRVDVLELRTGYRPRELAQPTTPELELHRAFAERFFP